MPQLAGIIPIILAATSAASLGITGYELANQPGAPKTATPTAAETTATADQTKQNQVAAVSQQFPNLQAQTGGSLSPDALIQLSTLLSGQGGAPGIGASQQQILELLTGSPTTPFQVSAGNSTPAPAGGTGLVSA